MIKCECFVIAGIGWGGYNFIIGIIASVCRRTQPDSRKMGPGCKNICIWALAL